jgi:hypothetical protein
MLGRAHAVAYPRGSFGIIVGDHIQPFAAHFAWEEETPSWGHSQIHMLLDHFQRLRAHRPDLARVEEDLRGILAEALPYLNRTPPALLHNDAHPWNVLVQADEDEWRCVAWLDWEYAWVGDPNWDLVRMDLFRRKPIGATPDAFWEGYGRSPAEPERSVYTLGIYLWMADQYLTGDRHLLPTYQAAMAYVDCIDDVIHGIRAWLA